MQITSIETYIAGNPWKNWLFAKVTTNEGVHGIGEGTLNYFGKTVEAAIHELKPLIIGMLPLGLPTQTAVLIRGVYPTNQALARFSAVPVFPAAGQP